MYFEYSDIKPFLIASCSNELDTIDDDGVLFEQLHDQAIEIIKRYCTLDETADFPKYLLLPAAWFVSFIYIQNSSKIEKDEQSRYSDLYEKAVVLLIRDKTKTSKIGDIEDLWV